MERKTKQTDDHLNENYDDSSSERVADDQKSEESLHLVHSIEQTLKDLKRASFVSSPRDDTDLDDDETHLKTHPPVERSKSRRKVSELIADDIIKAYRTYKINPKQEEKNQSDEQEESKIDKHKEGNQTDKQEESKVDKREEGNQADKHEAKPMEQSSIRYDMEQASLMGAVLGIGGRDKSKDEIRDSDVDYSPVESGTLMGLGAVENVDLRESDDKTSENTVPKHNIEESDKEKFRRVEVKNITISRKNRKEPGPSTPQNAEVKNITSIIGNQDQPGPSTPQKVAQEAEDFAETDTEMSCGISQKIRNWLHNLFRKE